MDSKEYNIFKKAPKTRLFYGACVISFVDTVEIRLQDTGKHICMHAHMHTQHGVSANKCSTTCSVNDLIALSRYSFALLRRLPASFNRYERLLQGVILSLTPFLIKHFTTSLVTSESTGCFFMSKQEAWR